MQNFLPRIFTKMICKYKIFANQKSMTLRNFKIKMTLLLLILMMIFKFLIRMCSCSARFLWKRIPIQFKAGNVELEKIHSVYICLWNNDIAGFFKIINYEWSNNIAELMFELRGL